LRGYLSGEDRFAPSTLFDASGSYTQGRDAPLEASCDATDGVWAGSYVDLFDGRQAAANNCPASASVLGFRAVESVGQGARASTHASTQFPRSHEEGAGMSSRETILKALRAASPPEFPRPAPPKGIVYEDPVAKFAEVLMSVGGVCVRVGCMEEADLRLREFQVYRESRAIASLVSGIGESTFDCERAEIPHDLKDLDLAILPGEFGVAENAAVWIPGKALGRHRVVFVIAQHLALVVSAAKIVNNMQEAYTRMNFERSGYGVFISGPSKTADIEQALVIGAHGARSCTVFVVG
jgi:L-lactate dehydrogenase complex protein LldG